MALTFSRLSIDDKETIIQFRKDAHVISFGNDRDFDEEQYLQFVQKGSSKFPDGFLFVLYDGKVIGQMELQIKQKDGHNFGFINLFYLTPEYRGKGFSHYLDQYAANYFKKNACSYCLLRVEKNNHRAVRFYEKNGFYSIKRENLLTTYKKDL